MLSTIDPSTRLLRAVRAELQWDPRTRGEAISASIAGQAVLLRGAVSSYHHRHAALEAVGRVEGVAAVIDRLEVRIPASRTASDAQVAARARRALAWAAFVPDERIRVSVVEGIVRLEGSVSCIAQSEDAERSIRMIPGLRGIDNCIVVGPRRRVRPPHILLVEDHVNTGRLLHRVLESEGMEVDCASSAAEARRLSQQVRFDLVISDIELPDGNGWDLLPELRRRDDPRAIAYTCHGTDAALQRSHDAGFDVHLTKPVPLSEVLTAIQALMIAR